MKTPRFTDVVKNLWLFRNPYDQSETVEVEPFSVPLDPKGYAEWEDIH